MALNLEQQVVSKGTFTLACFAGLLSTHSKALQIFQMLIAMCHWFDRKCIDFVSRSALQDSLGVLCTASNYIWATFHTQGDSSHFLSSVMGCSGSVLDMLQYISCRCCLACGPCVLRISQPFVTGRYSGHSGHNWRLACTVQQHQLGAKGGKD